MAADPNTPDGIDTEGKAVPPYEGRRQSAETRGKDATTKGGAKVGGATGPAEDEDMSSADPDQTPGGATGLPADEQPADETRQTERSDPGVGPAHQPGARRGEDRS
ncbi:hypothetical protein AB0J74_10255 [Asanoa sp. NPDC049573]|uniref:hypothetical protein n=1 Tax=Asanoa sp. NPDC049573 TaxID=3155396 RepID=UPI0034495F87